jgi:hypothetical protein
MPQLSQPDKLRALRILEMVADAGVEYRQRICEAPSEPIDVIVDYLAESAKEDDGMHGFEDGGSAGGACEGDGNSPRSASSVSPEQGASCGPRSGGCSPSGAAAEAIETGTGTGAGMGMGMGTTRSGLGLGKEPPMLHAQRLVMILGTENPRYSSRVEVKVCELMRYPNAYVQRAAAKLSRELLMANHALPLQPDSAAACGGVQHADNGGGSSSQAVDARDAIGSVGPREGEAAEDTVGDMGGDKGRREASSDAAAAASPEKGQQQRREMETAMAPAPAVLVEKEQQQGMEKERKQKRDQEQDTAAAAAPLHLPLAVEAVLPLTHSPNFRVQTEALLLLDELAKHPGAQEVIVRCRETFGFPPEGPEATSDVPEAASKVMEATSEVPEDIREG